MPATDVVYYRELDESVPVVNGSENSGAAIDGLRKSGWRKLVYCGLSDTSCADQ